MVGFTKLGVKFGVNLSDPCIPDDIFAIALSFIISMFGKLSGLVIESGSC